MRLSEPVVFIGRQYGARRTGCGRFLQPKCGFYTILCSISALAHLTPTMKYASAHQFLAYVADRNQGQPEFLQAVTEVLAIKRQVHAR